MTDSPLQNRTVVVTGAARGLGAALARACARRGARLALLGLEKPRLDALAAQLPTPVLAVEADVTDPDALDDAAGEVRRRLDRPSVVVANAGIAHGGPFATSDPAEWRRVVDVNLTGSAHTARAFLPDLLHTAGHHLQIASPASLGAAPMMSTYCASKAGVEAFNHSLRAEVAHRGVAVGIAYLNWIDTDMIRDADRESALVLDRRRLGKQRVEALQVLRGLTVPGYGWRRHPAVRMWTGYEEALVRYGLDVCRIWREQGHQDSCAASLVAGLAVCRPGEPVREQAELAAAGELPPWLGDEAFHRSHRSALVRKEPAVYAGLFPGVPDDLPYVWPSSDRERGEAGSGDA